jgi:hypothetical protein
MEEKLDVGKLLDELEELAGKGELDVKGVLMIKSQLAVVHALNTSNMQMERINHNIKELKLARRGPAGPV